MELGKFNLRIYLANDHASVKFIDSASKLLFATRVLCTREVCLFMTLGYKIEHGILKLVFYCYLLFFQ